MKIDGLNLVEFEEYSYEDITVHIVDVKKKEIVVKLDVLACEYIASHSASGNSVLDVTYDDDRGEIRIILPKNHVPYIEE